MDGKPNCDLKLMMREIDGYHDLLRDFSRDIPLMMIALRGMEMHILKQHTEEEFKPALNEVRELTKRFARQMQDAVAQAAKIAVVPVENVQIFSADSPQELILKMREFMKDPTIAADLVPQDMPTVPGSEAVH